MIPLCGNNTRKKHRVVKHEKATANGKCRQLAKVVFTHCKKKWLL
jgi:hypothetical protein